MSTINHWPPDGEILAVERVEMRLEPGPFAFSVREGAAIGENWARELAANPSLFNGDVLMQEEVALEEGVVRARAKMTDFATILWWRRQSPPSSGRSLVASAVPISSDGAAIIIRMAAHTANAGKICFAAGSLDASDLRADGSVDVEGSMSRELFEETGLATAQAEADPVLYATALRRRHFVFRFFRFPWTASEICERVAAHMARELEPEIDEVRAVRSPDEVTEDFDPLSRLILPFFFGGEGRMAG
ncbi:NUDIX domain-containing protein [Rhizobium sp. SSA_523]|uniref:NUDIX domain-containing protein n=1 Tax=Rhizobium sp. SSA_523 TaxID=2952477 RepID=UPI002090CD3F|nr:NUDIX domain-containing protein [Rhizobium sp. SSA_523]MCO5730228.1 NUDIX domain-containing protein [Rhizobium sp. SSA_523]WKC25286.1 NUDIX domain-containing protein [Rhizobium sp. SSA_523]